MADPHAQPFHSKGGKVGSKLADPSKQKKGAHARVEAQSQSSGNQVHAARCATESKTGAEKTIDK